MADGSEYRVWNSTLKRREPMRKYPFKSKAYEPMKRTALKRQSKKQASRLARYLPIRNDFLKKFPACGICLVLDMTPAPSTEVHHKFGRNGSLLFDVRGFVPSCRAHREWPHTNGALARELGVLGMPSEWGVPIDRHQPKIK